MLSREVKDEPSKRVRASAGIQALSPRPAGTRPSRGGQLPHAAGYNAGNQAWKWLPFLFIKSFSSSALSCAACLRGGLARPSLPDTVVMLLFCSKTLL